MEVDGVTKLRRGPKPKHPDGFKELHLKFSGDLLKHIEQSSENNYQAYFDKLVQRDMKQAIGAV
ncbi:MAG: hypothetical protein PVS3B3_32370 [Ktedonobacteraceae bacterium]